MSTTQPECVFVALGIRDVTRMRNIIVCGLPRSTISFHVFSLMVKGKAVPLQARSGLDSSRKLRFPDFMTTAQDGGKVVSLVVLKVKVNQSHYRPGVA